MCADTNKSIATDTADIENTPQQLVENTARRSLLVQMAAAGPALLGLGIASGNASSQEIDADAGVDALRFPGDPPEHQVVYQFNKSEPDYQQQVLFSVGAMVRKYGDNIKIVVTCFGPGIHILARNPRRPVSDEIKQRVASLDVYGVEFHACGNTLKSLNWTEKDLVPFAKVVEVGAADLLELQEQGFSYISW